VAPQSNQGAATPTRPAVDAMRIESEVELLRSSGVLAAAAQALALDRDREFAGSTTEETIQNLAERLAIARRGSSAIIAIEARSRSAVNAARIANTVAVVGAAQQRARKAAELADQATALRHGAMADAGPGDESTADDHLRRAARSMTARAAQVTDLRFVSAALIPPKARFPNWPVSLALAGVMAFGLGVLRALNEEARLGGFRDPRDVEARFGIHAFVIDLPEPPTGTTPGSSGSIGDGTAKARDAWLRLCAGITQLLAMPGNKRKASGTVSAPLLLVGAVRSDEAALAARVTLGLARMLTDADRRILLIEHDVAHPQLVRILNLRPRAGLQDLLAVTDQPRAPSVIIADEKEGLDLILAHDGVAGDGSDLPRFDRLRPLLTAARGSYDLVVALGSPTATLAEPIAGDASLVLLVIGSHRVPSRVVATAVDGLRAAINGKPSIAALLTRAPGGNRRFRRPRRVLDAGHPIA
jgi:hypothetical protein